MIGLSLANSSVEFKATHLKILFYGFCKHSHDLQMLFSVEIFFFNYYLYSLPITQNQKDANLVVFLTKPNL